MPKDEIQEIKIPKESIADDSVLLLKWYKENGEEVNKGDNIANCETSKAIFDIEAPIDGYLFYQYKVGDEIPVGHILAIISQQSTFSFDLYYINRKLVTQIQKKEILHKKQQDEFKKIRFSKKALDLIEENNLNKNLFLDLNMVTKKEVLNYLNQSEEHRNIISGDNIIKSSIRRVVMLGGGGHAKMCIDIMKQMKTYEIIGIVDRNIKMGTKVMGIPVIAKDRDIDFKRLYNDGIKLSVIGIGAAKDHSMRDKVYKKLKKFGFYLPNIIHPKASIEASVIMGEGNQFMANAILGSEVKIQNNCIINSGAIVSHDSVLENNVHIAPGAILAGGVFVGENSLIGMGSTIYLYVKIGKHVTIYNNCSITKNVPDNSIIKNNFM